MKENDQSKVEVYSSASEWKIKVFIHSSNITNFTDCRVLFLSSIIATTKRYCGIDDTILFLLHTVLF